LYRAPEKYLEPLELVFAGFTKEDKALMPQIAVPVGVPEQCAIMGLCSAETPKEQAVGDLVLIKSYYLLRMGKYTQKSKKRKTRTIQFCVKDMAFKKGNVILPRNVSLKDLLEATAVTLSLSNKKMELKKL